MSQRVHLRARDPAVGQDKDILYPVPKALLKPGRISRAPACRARDPVRQPGQMRSHSSLSQSKRARLRNCPYRRCPRHWQDQDIHQVVQLGPVHPRLPGVSKVATKNEGIGLRMDLKWNCRRELFHEGIHWQLTESALK